MPTRFPPSNFRTSRINRLHPHLHTVQSHHAFEQICSEDIRIRLRSIRIPQPHPVNNLDSFFFFISLFLFSNHFHCHISHFSSPHPRDAYGYLFRFQFVCFSFFFFLTEIGSGTLQNQSLVSERPSCSPSQSFFL